MSKGKKPPERSKIERAKPLAYQRRASDDARVVSEDKKPTEARAETPTEDRPTGEMTAVEKPSEADAPKMPEAKASAEAAPKPAKDAETALDEKSATSTKGEATPESKGDKGEAKAEKAEKAESKGDKGETKAESKGEKVESKGDKAESKPEPTPEAPPVKPEARTTATMSAAVGTPPDVPGEVENPTSMPSKDELPPGAPTDAAKAPGSVPQGDSRSLRRGPEFALIYRQGSAVITRFGTIGQRGQWRVVEYPTPSSASNAYAKECSRFVGEGFSDYRD